MSSSLVAGMLKVQCSLWCVLVCWIVERARWFSRDGRAGDCDHEQQGKPVSICVSRVTANEVETDLEQLLLKHDIAVLSCVSHLSARKERPGAGSFLLSLLSPSSPHTTV